MKNKKNKIGFIIGILSISIVSAKEYNFFETEEQFQKTYQEIIQEEEKKLEEIKKIETQIEKICERKLQTRCQFIQDKITKENNIKENTALICKQIICLQEFQGNFTKLRTKQSTSCKTINEMLTKCDTSKNISYETSSSFGLKERKKYIIPLKAPFDKIEKMLYAQNKAYEKGFSEEESQSIVYQLNVENTEWSENRMGDWWCKGKSGAEDYCEKFKKFGRPIQKKLYPCSFGLIQLNACVQFGKPADEYYKKNKKWHDYKFQINTFIDFLAAKKEEYKGDFTQAQVHWNYPAASKNGYHKTVPYFEKLQNMKTQFEQNNNELKTVEIAVPKKAD